MGVQVVYGGGALSFFLLVLSRRAHTTHTLLILLTLNRPFFWSCTSTTTTTTTTTTHTHTHTHTHTLTHIHTYTYTCLSLSSLALSLSRSLSLSLFLACLLKCHGLSLQKNFKSRDDYAKDLQAKFMKNFEKQTSHKAADYLGK